MTELLCDTIQTTELSEVEVESMQTTDSTHHRHQFSVWRIVQRMPNATPQQLDSAIQANLPVRELHLSTQPDTLEIPGLHTKDPYENLQSMPHCYQMGYFQCDSLLHPEIQIRQNGFSGVPLPYTLWRDNWVTTLVLLCFVLLTFILRNIKGRMVAQIKDFFFPSRNNNSSDPAEDKADRKVSYMMTLILCLMGGLGAFIYAQARLQVFLGQLSPYTLIGLYITLWLSYFLVKRLLYAFTNWIFFKREEIITWNSSVGFLISVECLAFFPIILVAVYFNIPFDMAFWTIAAVVIFTKILLFWKTFRIFFENIYGILHLIVYFCTLEVMPMLVLLKTLMTLTENLIVKF